MFDWKDLINWDEGSAGGGNPGNVNPTGGGRTLTQAEIDAIMGGVRSETREATKRKLLDDLGVKNEEELKALVKAGQEAEGKITAAKSDAEKIMAAANERLIRSAVLLKAKELRFIDPEDAWTYADRAKLTVKDDGSVDGVEAAVKSVAETKKHLVEPESKPGGTPRSQGTPAQGVNDADIEALKRRQLDFTGF